MANFKCDRREISRLLLKHFPGMAEASSDEWHGFLDNITGLVTPKDEPNATAFDRWRQALKEQGYPVWGYTPERLAQIKARVEELQLEEAKRIKDLPELLATLKKDAPLVTAAELLKAKP